VKVFIKTFGCKVNQIESQWLAEKFESAGYSVCRDFEPADACVLNTCSVTKEADRDAARLLRAITRRNPSAKLAVTGCYATLSPEKILADAPGSLIVKNEEKEKLPEKLFSVIAGTDGWKISGHKGRSRAFVKIQDGCDAGCAYCLVPLARAKKISKPAEAVSGEISELKKLGFSEMVLCGINLGEYKCPETGAGLPGLLEKIFRLKENFRIRLSSVEMNCLAPEFLPAAASGGEKFCDHFHVPLQSGSAQTLRDMGRRYAPEAFLRRLEAVKKVFPNAGIYCDVIAGYPTETEKNFGETEKFCAGAGFSGLHVFSFSARPGTRAFNLKPLAPEAVKQRAETLRALDKKLRRDFAEKLVGTSQRVLIEKPGAKGEGVSSNFQRVEIQGAKNQGEIIKVKISSARDGVCLAEL